MPTLYLRAVPEHLVREAKAAAARRGVTLTAFVSEALAQSLGVDAPERQGVTGTLHAEMAWYEAQKQNLLRRYRGEYLAIAHKKVIDHDKEFGPLARRVFKRLGVRPVFMPMCVDGERVVTIPSPRVAKA
jgi:hypothetical protein